MKEYQIAIMPFQLVLSYFILRAFYHKVDFYVYSSIFLCLVTDAFGTIKPDFLPLSSFFVMVSILLFYERGTKSVFGAALANILMFGAYFFVPMGNFFVTAVNYYVSYTLMHTLTENENYIKNMLFWASMKNLSVAGAFWLMPGKNLDVVPSIFSVAIIYYMVRASLYYRARLNQQ